MSQPFCFVVERNSRYDSAVLATGGRRTFPVTLVQNSDFCRIIESVLFLYVIRNTVSRVTVLNFISEY